MDGRTSLCKDLRQSHDVSAHPLGSNSNKVMIGWRKTIEYTLEARPEHLPSNSVVSFSGFKHFMSHMAEMKLRSHKQPPRLRLWKAEQQLQRWQAQTPHQLLATAGIARR